MEVTVSDKTKTKSFDCSICSKSFIDKLSLKAHMLFHSEEKPHVCNICQKSFFRKKDLNRHTYTHSEVKPHICNICNKSFAQKGTLTGHMLYHTGEKPYECNMCNKSYTRKDNLQLHLLIHTGEKPHECNICHKSFKRKDSLQYHLASHSEEKPHVCNVCNKCFATKQGWRKHSRIHGKRESYLCIICEKAFIKKSSLKKLEDASDKGKFLYACTKCYNKRESLKQSSTDKKEKICLATTQSKTEIPSSSYTRENSDAIYLIDDASIKEEHDASEGEEQESDYEDMAYDNVKKDSDVVSMEKKEKEEPKFLCDEYIFIVVKEEMKMDDEDPLS